MSAGNTPVCASSAGKGIGFMGRQLGGIGLGVLLIGCSASAPSAPGNPGDASRATASPRATMSVEPQASAEPTSSGSADPDGLEPPDILSPLAPDSLAVVVTDNLVVRSLPEISAASTIHPVYLQEGIELFVMDGPVYSDGFAWYEVTPLGPRFGDDVAPEEPLPRIGWIASGEPSDPWLVPWDGECPSADLDSIWRERALVLLACFGDVELALDGIRTRCSYSVPGYIEPTWLNHVWCELIPFDSPADGVAVHSIGFMFHEETGQPVSDTATPMRVVGHFDDPAALTCEEDPLQGMEAAPAELVVLHCRSRFVATEVTQLDR